MKEDFFSKFKDYNKELEKILEKKDFSKDTKNLLLSMFYKIEMSYNDYFTVKRKTISKQEYLENILNNVKNSNSIRVVKTNEKEFNELQKNKKYNTDLKLKKIEVVENELALLSAILELNNFQIRLREEYNLIRNSMPYLLNLAYDIENVEVLRDFNAWSWNTLINKAENIDVNLTYQNLKMALNFDIFEKLQKDNKNLDVMEIIKEELYSKLPKEIVDRFLFLIFKISIIIYIKVNKNENKRLSEEKSTIQDELEKIKNKKEYINNITKEKKELNKQLQKLDLILNDNTKLKEEYQKRNEKLSEYNKIFSISHLEEKIQKEKNKIIEKIRLLNKKIEPQTYLEDVKELEKNNNLLENINFTKENNVYLYINELEQLFLKEILYSKIENIDSKQELIDFAYELRYYNLLPYNNEIQVKDVKEVTTYLEAIKEKNIKKLYDNKIINTLSTNEKNDIEIVKEIFNLRIISLEDIYMQIKKHDNKYLVQIYDEKSTLEKEIELNLKFNKKDKIKLNKKIKLFI
jgi:hypothetical protein